MIGLLEVTVVAGALLAVIAWLVVVFFAPGEGSRAFGRRAVQWLAAIVLVWLPAGAAGQAERWSVDDAVARALANPDIAAVSDHEAREVRARVDEQTRAPAPRLGVEYEHVFDDEDSRELSVAVEQELDLTDWRGRLRRAVPHRQAAAAAEREAWRLDVAQAVYAAFYEVRYRQERVAVMDGWIEHLEGGVEAIAARERRGDTSVYDVRRVQREVETARAQRGREASMLAEAWSSLRAWTPWSAGAGRPTLMGALLPSGEPTADAPALPELRRLESLALSLAAEREVWGDPFWRGWTLGAGYRLVDEAGMVGHGLLLSLSLPLTLWNTDRATIDRVEAEQARVGSELRLERGLAEQAAEAARERYESALQALQHVSTPEGDGELTHLAETAYSAGEASLTELLDAYASEAELHLARIELEWEARRAWIELSRRQGTFEHEVE